MFDLKTSDTPMTTTIKMERDEVCARVNATKYRGMTESLLYMIANRPNIVFSVGTWARFQLAPKESHLKAMK